MQLAAQILTVDSSGDTSDATAGDGICDDGTGVCTLRAAIEEANANASITTIAFSSAMTISPATALPNISRANLLLDGTSAPGASCGTLVAGTAHTLQVIIDGSGQASGKGLSVTANDVTVQGVVLQNGPSDGMSISGNNITVQCCYIGTDQSGSGAAANSGHGISASGVNTMNTIKNNLISGNSNNGVYIGILHSITATGNLIGTNAAGNAAIANQDGIGSFGSKNCIIGGSGATDRNVISGNNGDGFDGGGTGSSNNAFYGNYIGTDISGTADLGNGGIGIRMHNGNGSYIIGGSGAGEGNVISGNGSFGIRIMSGTTVMGNYIGTDYAGTSDLGNDDTGIYLRGGTDDCIIGNTGSGSNLVAYNGGAGIAYAGSSGTNGSNNMIQGNSTFNNSGLGIDLNDDGATANDTDDADVGANNLQNCPDVASAQPNGSDIDVTFSVSSITANSTYPLTIDFYKADSDSEEGQTWIGSVSYTSGEATTSVTKSFTPAVATGSGEVLVATATDALGNTSEFSPPVSNLLPVELFHFTVQVDDDKAVLRWTTASETNNAGFEVEQKSGHDWERIGFVAGAGHSTTDLDYSFKTNALAAGQYFFRLRQMDYDGQAVYSNIISTKMAGTNTLISFFPNPVADQAILKIVAEKEGAMNVLITNTNGQLVKQYTLEKSDGENQWKVQLGDLRAGQYFLQVEDGGEVFTQRFMRQ